MNSFDRIDHTQARDDAERAEGAFDADLGHMMVTAFDYARWNGLRQLSQSSGVKALRDHFSYDLLHSMKINVVVVFAADGSVLFSTQTNTDRHELQGADAELLQAFQRNFLRLTNRRRMHERLVRHRSGLFAYAAAPVSTTDGAAGTVLLFARIIDADQTQRVRKNIDAGLELSLPDRDGRFAGTNDTRTLHWIASSPPSERFFAHAANDQQMNAYVLLRDIEGQRAGLLVLHRDRNIYQLVKRTTSILLGILFVLVMIAGAVVLVLCRRLQRSITAHEAVKYRYANVAAHLQETIVLAEPQSGRIIEANAALTRALGYSAEQIKERKLQDIYIGLPLKATTPTERGTSSIQECRVLASGGQNIDMEVTVSTIEEHGEQLLCVLGRDITARKRAEQQATENRRKLAHLANHDPLTGLPNRLFLQTRLPRLLRKLADSKRLLAVFYVDVDHFKNVNDLHGHGSGDQLLRVFAKRLKAATGSHDIVIRMGGDEFVVIASLLPDLNAVENIATRLVATAQAPIVLEDTTVSVGSSIGVSVYPDHGLDAESLLKHADIALYQAKENGRNGYKIFTSHMDVAVSEHVALEQALRHAIGTEQLFLEYQPVVDLVTGRLESFEALLRWRHPEIGYVPPMRFIPVAEKSGLIVPLGEQVLRMVCIQLRAWLDENVPLAPVAINISPLQLRRTPISTLIHELTLEFDLDPKLLHFEITESAVVQQSQDLFVTLQTLRELGSKVSIDDFGTGFSNLSYLKHMPIDAIKIDKAFVQDVVRDQSDAAIVSGIVSMARQLRLRTVAEGIETSDQHARLRELGCMFGQGYLFSKPIEPRRCKALLEQLGVQRRLTDTVKIRAFGAG